MPGTGEPPGNPFFLVELARLDEEDVAEVPATVRDVVTRRLAVLDDGPSTRCAWQRSRAGGSRR